MSEESLQTEGEVLVVDHSQADPSNSMNLPTPVCSGYIAGEFLPGMDEEGLGVPIRQESSDIFDIE